MYKREQIFAKLLTKQKKEWLYEARKFKLGKTTDTGESFKSISLSDSKRTERGVR